MTPSRWLFIFALSLCAGITLVVPELPLWIRIAVGCSLAGVLLRWHGSWRAWGLGILCVAGAAVHTQQALVLPRAPQGFIDAPGVVRRVTQVDTDTSRVVIDIGQSVFVSVSLGAQPPQVGDAGQLRCRSVKTDTLRPSIARRERLVGTCATPSFIVKAPGAWYNPYRILAQARQGFMRAVHKALPFAEASLGIGMVIGDTSGVDRATLDAFRTTGLTHLVAVSGANLALVLAVVITFLQTRLPRGPRLVVFSLLTVGFVLLTGGDSSIVRAGIMAVLALVVQACGRKPGTLNVLVLAGMVMLWVNPTFLWDDRGFALSFGATYGLVAWGQPMQRGMERWRFPAWLAEALAATFAASLATLPISLSSFQRLPAISPLANIVVVPLIPWIMILVSVAGIVALVFPPLAMLPGTVAWLLIRAVAWVANRGSAISWASMAMSPLTASLLGLSVFLLTSFIFRKHVRQLFQ